MPETVNTAPLGNEQYQDSADERPIMINVDHVSMVFNMASEQLNSLKEYAIAIAKHELMFKEFRALDNVSFTIRKGDVFGILGTNGSGKSTMLKIIAGVLEPSDGTCSINGNIAPLIELGAGFDFELTARENIYLNGALLGYSKRFIDKHFDEIVEFAEVERFLDMPMKNYSSGMVARIAFAIATVIVPEILIVDEVLSVGDFMFQQKCEQRIKSLIKDHDVTVLIVSHNNEQIERLCNKAIWIEKGHTRMIGDAHTVCNTYRVLGGHIGSAESERVVFEMLNNTTTVNDSLIETIVGENRYGSAAKITQRCNYFQNGTVILAPGDQPSLCFSAAGLAGILNAPLLLIKPDSIPDVTLQEIARLNPSSIIVLGINRQHHNMIDNELQSVCPQAEISFDESAPLHQAAESIYHIGITAKGLVAWGKTAIVSWDGCFSDLMSFMPFINKEHAPVFFLDESDSLPNGIYDLLKSGQFSKALFLGSSKTFPNALLDDLTENGCSSERVCADNPSEANAYINSRFVLPTISSDKFEAMTIIVSSTWHPFDSFAIGRLAAERDAIILLEDTSDLDSTAHAIKYVQELNRPVASLTFIGDNIRFSNLDKLLLAKAATIANAK